MYRAAPCWGRGAEDPSSKSGRRSRPILLARHRIGPPFQTLVHVALRTIRLAVAEHVETFGVPVIHRFLNSFFGLTALCGKFGCRVGAEIDVPFFLSDNVRIFDYTGKRQIRAIDELLELKTTYPVDQKTKDRKVLPGLNLATKGFHISLFIWSAERVGNVDPDIASEAGHFSKVIHFLSRRAGHDELIELGRRIRQNILDVKIGTANFAIRLNRQNTAQKILIFRVLLVKVFSLYFIGKHRALL